MAEVPAGVGRTALIIASARMAETRRADGLFTDPWAEVLVRAAQDAPETRLDDDRSELWDFFREYLPARTVYLDRQVTDGVAAGAGQVVLPAAGLDARVARLGLPDGVPVFELDTEPVLRFKADVLGAAGLDTPRRVPVAVDLAGDWPSALVAAGFRPDVPTVWIAEGLLFYLTAATCDRLLDAVVGLSAPGSRIAVEYFDRNPREAGDFVHLEPADQQALDTVIALFDDGPPASPARWLPAHGVETLDVSDVAGEIVRLGRPLPRLLDPRGPHPAPMTIWLATGRTAGRPAP